MSKNEKIEVNIYGQNYQTEEWDDYDYEDLQSKIK